MIIPINLSILIDMAKRESGMTFGTLANEMHIHQPRLNEWRHNKGEPSSDQIAYMADKAGLPILETVAALKPEWANVWTKAKQQVTSLYYSLGAWSNLPRFSAL